MQDHPDCRARFSPTLDLIICPSIAGKWKTTRHLDSVDSVHLTAQETRNPGNVDSCGVD